MQSNSEQSSGKLSVTVPVTQCPDHASMKAKYLRRY
jgi:hypothetical protein